MVFVLSGFVTPSAYAWQEVDTMNMCNQPTHVIRTYQGDAKGWVNRDHYNATQQHQTYARNCPQVTAPKKTNKKKKVYRKTKRQPRRSKTCQSCYKKGYKAGYRAAHKKSHHRKVQRKKVRRITRGYPSHAAKIADCKRVDQANYENRSKVIARW
jgi:hypothetical protein